MALAELQHAADPAQKLAQNGGAAPLGDEAAAGVHEVAPARKQVGDHGLAVEHAQDEALQGPARQKFHHAQAAAQGAGNARQPDARGAEQLGVLFDHAPLGRAAQKLALGTARDGGSSV